MNYEELFCEKHQEKFLKPISDTVAAIRKQAIRIWALESFTPEQIAILGGESSMAIIQSDKLPPRTIILNIHQISHYAGTCDISFEKALELTIFHELSHIALLDNFGVIPSTSEFDAWQAIEPFGIVPVEDFKNFRDYAMHRKPPTFDHRRSFDNSPEWLRTFNRLSPTIGYGLAWGAARQLADQSGLMPWEITTLLIDSGWSIDIAIDIVESDRVESALFGLAISRRDFNELHGVRAAASPVPAKPIQKFVPEQPLI